MFTGLESPIHLIIVLVVVLLLFGAERVPELARGLGEGVREFRKGTQGQGDAALEEAPDEAPDEDKERKSR